MDGHMLEDWKAFKAFVQRENGCILQFYQDMNEHILVEWKQSCDSWGMLPFPPPLITPVLRETTFEAFMDWLQKRKAKS